LEVPQDLAELSVAEDQAEAEEAAASGKLFPFHKLILMTANGCCNSSEESDAGW